MKKQIFELFTGILIGVFLTIIFSPRHSNSVPVPQQDSITLLPEHPYYLLEEVNDTVLYKTLVHYGFKYPEIITAQAVLETGNFKSRLCIEGNNLFGLYNSSKKTYFKYDSWISCVFAYKEFIADKYDNKQSYIQYLKTSGYAEDPKYIEKVKKISLKYK